MVVFNLNENKHIFIYWSTTSRKEYFITWLLEVYKDKKWVSLLLSDPLMCQFYEYLDFALYNKNFSNTIQFIEAFEKAKTIDWKVLIFISELSDFIKDWDYSEAFKKILKDILDWVYPNITIIFQMQPTYLLDKIEWLYNHENVIMFDFNN